MAKLSPSLGLSTLKGDGLGADPREGLVPSFEGTDISPEIAQLFSLALEGTLPRTRELKPWEPAKLNQRHLSMIMMRVGGMKQREIAEVFGATDGNISIVMNHPDAEYLRSRLAAAKFSMPTAIEQRLQDLNESSVEALEELLGDKEISPTKRAPAAFRVLEMNGYGKKRVEEHNHTHRFEANPKQLAQLTKAIQESREIPDAKVIETQVAIQELESSRRQLSPGGGPTASPPSALPGSPGVGAPSIDDPQEQDERSES